MALTSALAASAGVLFWPIVISDVDTLVEPTQMLSLRPTSVPSVSSIFAEFDELVFPVPPKATSPVGYTAPNEPAVLATEMVGAAPPLAVWVKVMVSLATLVVVMLRVKLAGLVSAAFKAAAIWLRVEPAANPTVDARMPTLLKVTPVMREAPAGGALITILPTAGVPATVGAVTLPATLVKLSPLPEA